MANTTKKTSLRLDEDSVLYIKVLAAHYGISGTAVIKQLLRLKMREEGLGAEVNTEKVKQSYDK